MAKRTRSELVAIVQKMLDGEGDDAQVAAWLAELRENVPHPAISDLIYWHPTKDDPTAEEVIDEAMAYKPKAQR